MRTTLIIALLMSQTCAGNATQWEEDGHVLGNWYLWFGTSELDDSPAVLAENEDESSGYGLVVRCNENVPAVSYYFVDDGEQVSGNMIEVAIRFDKGVPEQMEWFPTANGIAAVIDEDAAWSFITSMNAVDELYIRAFDNNIGTRDARFQMIGFREVAYQVQKACSENDLGG